MSEIFPKECIKVFRPELASNGIIVSLPSAGRKYLPYFTRVKWNILFPDKCFIACADPSILECDSSLNGTWFLDKEKGSRLVDFASWLNKFLIENIDGEKAKIVFTGSSMGGYASIYLANLFEGSYAFAECPQINLYNYPGSKKAIDAIFHESDKDIGEHTNLIKLTEKLDRVPCVHIFLPATDVHHLGKHVFPYARSIGSILKEKSSSSCYFKVSVEQNATIPTGHAPISKELFRHHIDNLFSEMGENSTVEISILTRFKIALRKLVS